MKRSRHLSARAAGCEGKVRYHSYIDAQSVADRIAERSHRRRVHPYRCRFCNGFHIGRFSRPRHTLKGVQP